MWSSFTVTCLQCSCSNTLSMVKRDIIGLYFLTSCPKVLFSGPVSLPFQSLWSLLRKVYMILSKQYICEGKCCEQHATHWFCKEFFSHLAISIVHFIQRWVRIWKSYDTMFSEKRLVKFGEGKPVLWKEVKTKVMPPILWQNRITPTKNLNKLSIFRPLWI